MDIMCLQGVTFGDAQRQIHQDLRDTYPYIHSAVDFSADYDVETPACTLTQVDQFAACIEENCPSTEQGFSLSCIASRLVAGCHSIEFCIFFCRCGELQRSFSDKCADCITLYLPSPSGFTACLSDSADRFERHYGLMLISRRELKNTKVSGFNPLSQFRGYLKATVSLPVYHKFILAIL